MAHFDTEKWPTPTNRSILLKRQEAWDGEESEGGAIRADPEGIRVRHRKCKGGGGQAGRSPAHGSSGAGKCRAAGAQANGALAVGARTTDPFYQCHSRSRP